MTDILKLAKEISCHIEIEFRDGDYISAELGAASQKIVDIIAELESAEPVAWVHERTGEVISTNEKSFMGPSGAAYSIKAFASPQPAPVATVNEELLAALKDMYSLVLQWKNVGKVNYAIGSLTDKLVDKSFKAIKQAEQSK